MRVRDVVESDGSYTYEVDDEMAARIDAAKAKPRAARTQTEAVLAAVSAAIEPAQIDEVHR
jgi:hypothetical protein